MTDMKIEGEIFELLASIVRNDTILFSCEFSMETLTVVFKIYSQMRVESKSTEELLKAQRR